MPDKTLGEIAHDAYGRFLEKSGASHMPWEHIGEELQDAWKAAALAVSREKDKKDETVKEDARA